jgi:hypothetical protein
VAAALPNGGLGLLGTGALAPGAIGALLEQAGSGVTGWLGQATGAASGIALSGRPAPWGESGLVQGDWRGPEALTPDEPLRPWGAGGSPDRALNGLSLNAAPPVLFVNTGGAVLDGPGTGGGATEGHPAPTAEEAPAPPAAEETAEAGPARRRNNLLGLLGQAADLIDRASGLNLDDVKEVWEELPAEAPESLATGATPWLTVLTVAMLAYELARRDIRRAPTDTGSPDSGAPDLSALDRT